MSKQDAYALLDLCLYVGAELIRTGAETYRVEDSCMRLLQCYAAKNPEVFALANYIAVSFEASDGERLMAQKRILERSDSLHRLDRINAQLRLIGQDPPAPQQALATLQVIAQLPRISFLRRIFSTGLIGFSFTWLLGGSFPAALLAFVIAMAVRLGTEQLQAWGSNRMLVNIWGGFLAVMLSHPVHWIGFSAEIHVITTGAFMFMFPGLALTNAIRDLMASDYLAGLSKTIEAILVAASIAIGSTVAFSLLAIL